jgi:putative DNA primase/helicase
MLNNFHPDHLTDLRKSGLSDETITAGGFQSIPPRLIRKKLGFDFPNLNSMYEIPYPGCEGFSRFRCFPAEGKQVARYMQPKDSGNHLYIPTAVASKLSDPTTTLYITEGEKKALKACQEGLACIAIGGLWNYRDNDGGLISDFDKITWEGRTVFIVPDNDYLKPNIHGYKKNLEQAVQELACALIDKGAKVFVVELPDGPAKGIDDYLLIHSVAEFQTLPSKQIRKLTLEEAVAEVTLDSLDAVLKRVAKIPSSAKQEAHVAELSRLLKISKTAIKKDLKHFGAKVDGEKEKAVLPFTEAEPWAGEVDPARLLSDIAQTIRRFIVCTEEIANAVALWVALTWFIDVVQVAPMLNLTSPEKRCGKTLLLTLLGRLCERALTSSNISPSALFRAIDTWKPTLLIDEADAFMKDNEELRGLLNSGHSRDSAFVVKCVGKSFTPTRFNTFGMKAISGIGHISDTLQDRSIILELRRKLSHETVERIRHAEPTLFDDLRSNLARFADDHSDKVRLARPPLPNSLNDREQDNWEGLLAIAELAGENWLQIGTTTALKLSGCETASPTIGVELLADIQAIFDLLEKDRISTAEMISELCLDAEKPWKTYNKGVPISPRQVAGRLKGFGIKSKTIRIGFETPKGYEKEQFTEAFSRYASPIPENIRHTPQTTSVLNSSVSDTKNGTDVLRTEKPTKPSTVLSCVVVADKTTLPEASTHILSETTAFQQVRI